MSRLRLTMIAALCLLASCSRTDKQIATTRPVGPSPNPSLSPADVIKTVVLSMQHNDTPEPDAGITTAFRFASPGNRKFTGPVEHFIPMVKSPAYAPLLNFKSADFSAVEIRSNEARAMIRITTPDDHVYIYGWTLSKQDEGEFQGCWMTDQVVPLEISPQGSPPAPSSDATPI